MGRCHCYSAALLPHTGSCTRHTMGAHATALRSTSAIILIPPSHPCQHTEPQGRSWDYPLVRPQYPAMACMVCLMSYLPLKPRRPAVDFFSSSSSSHSSSSSLSSLWVRKGPMEPVGEDGGCMGACSPAMLPLCAPFAVQPTGGCVVVNPYYRFCCSAAQQPISCVSL